MNSCGFANQSVDFVKGSFALKVNETGLKSFLEVSPTVDTAEVFLSPLEASLQAAVSLQKVFALCLW